MFSPSARKKKTARSALKIVTGTRKKLEISLDTSKISKSPVSKAYFKHLLARAGGADAATEKAVEAPKPKATEKADTEVVASKEDSSHEDTEMVDATKAEASSSNKTAEDAEEAADVESDAAQDPKSDNDFETPTLPTRTPTEPRSDLESPVSTTPTASSTPTDGPTPIASPVSVAVVEKGEDDVDEATPQSAADVGVGASEVSQAVKLSSKIAIPALARARKAKLAAERCVSYNVYVVCTWKCANYVIFPSHYSACGDARAKSIIDVAIEKGEFVVCL